MVGFGSAITQDVPPYMLVDGNPYRDLSCLLGQGEHLKLIVKGGVVQYDELEKAGA